MKSYSPPDRQTQPALAKPQLEASAQYQPAQPLSQAGGTDFPRLVIKDSKINPLQRRARLGAKSWELIGHRPVDSLTTMGGPTHLNQKPKSLPPQSQERWRNAGRQHEAPRLPNTQQVPFQRRAMIMGGASSTQQMPRQQIEPRRAPQPPTGRTPYNAPVLQRVAITGNLEEGMGYQVRYPNGTTILARFMRGDENKLWFYDINSTENDSNFDVYLDENVEIGKNLGDFQETVGGEADGLPRIHEDHVQDSGVAGAINALAEQNKIQIVQGNFLAGAFNAPAGAWGLISAPLVAGAAPGANPPGWIGNAHPNHHHRGHLIGKQFGGAGTVNNLMTLTDGTNSSGAGMTGFENPLAKLMTANPGVVFLYNVTPVYKPGWSKKTGALATGGAGNLVVGHPAPQKVTMQAKNLFTGAVIGPVTVPNGLLWNHAGCVD